jgi:hypothetical protein
MTIHENYKTKKRQLLIKDTKMPDTQRSKCIFCDYSETTEGSYLSNGKGFKINADIIQHSQHGESKHHTEDIWFDNSDGTYTYVDEEEKRVSILTLQSENTYVIESYIDATLWTTELGILSKDKRSITVETKIYLTAIGHESHEYVLTSERIRQAPQTN